MSKDTADQLLSPRIEKIGWGKLSVSGEKRSFKDAKLFPGGVQEWDWKKTGTHHRPGIQPADLEAILGRGVQVVILSLGFWKQLQVMTESLALLQREGVEFHILETRAASRLYNKLRKSVLVAGLFHTTC